MRFYTEWMTGQALPFWSEAGFDAAAGRFRERLDWGGRPLDVPHRSMLQARQIYVFAHAELLGWHRGGGRLAETAMRSLRRDFCEETDRQASFAFSIRPDGQPVSGVRDAYAHAFVLFAIAWLYRLNGDAGLLALADKVAAFIDDALVDPEHGGLFDASPVESMAKRQNPLMHLLESYLALERAAPERGFLERAKGLVALFRAHLFDARRGVLLEHFARDWSAHPDPAKADAVEAGHHFEWVWLLREYETLGGESAAGAIARLDAVARAHGRAANGLIFDEIDGEGRVRKADHRLWPHTEAIKAATVRAADGDPEARPFAETMARALLDNFLDRPFAGGWVDQIDSAGRPLVDYVPASSLYHLFFAAAEADCAFGAEAAPAAAPANPDGVNADLS